MLQIESNKVFVMKSFAILYQQIIYYRYYLVKLAKLVLSVNISGAFIPGGIIPPYIALYPIFYPLMGERTSRLRSTLLRENDPQRCFPVQASASKEVEER